jgi:hypothetical protein|tara:strand:+ start:218 stop:505 length:288 start_codon:yes stop_codon:yes gene_type:complete
MAMLEQTPDGVKLFVKVVPNASKNELSGVIGNRLKVRIKSPPENGKANKAVCILIADILGLKKNAVSVISGNTNSKKTVAVIGVSLDIARSKLSL